VVLVAGLLIALPPGLPRHHAAMAAAVKQDGAGGETAAGEVNTAPIYARDSNRCLDKARAGAYLHDSKHCHVRWRPMRREELLERVRERVPGEDLSPRLLRYLIAEGVIDPPHGPDSAPVYTDRHVAQFCSYFGLKEQGYSLRQMSALRQAPDGPIPASAARREPERFLGGSLPPVRVAPGVYLSIAPQELAEPVDPDQVAGQVRAFLDSVLVRRSEPDAS
jgi:DNA-binding transcriptional MerR regulator